MNAKLNKALDNLGSFSPKEKTLIAEAGTPVTVPSAWAPMLEGTPADKVYLILEGEVLIRRDREDVARLGPGELVGETALARRRLRNATVVAASPLNVVHFTAAAWSRL